MGNCNSNSRQFFFVIKLWATSLQNIIEEQYILARKLNISPDVSNLIPEFERSIYIRLLIKELEEEEKAIKKSSKKKG